MDQWYVWLIIIIILTILELMTTNLTTIWFVVSALIALLVSFITDNYLIQFTLFVIIGILLLVTTKPILEKLIKVKREATNVDRIIGEIGIVSEKITPNKNGEVKIDGKRWTAKAEKTIHVGSNVKVLSISGVKIKVEEVEK